MPVPITLDVPAPPHVAQEAEKLLTDLRRCPRAGDAGPASTI